MTWSPQQESALKAVRRWLVDGEKQVFRLFGYAGTGKTTLAKEIAGMVKGKVLFGAFTGKAALVLRTKGCAGATTIHRMIYTPEEDEDTGRTVFKLSPLSPVAGAKLVIIDECSMVDEELGRDLLSFGTKVLVLGDPMQLPPVKGSGFFTSADPDFLLTEIHRQAADNPIIALATAVREGARLQPGNFGSSVVLRGRPPAEVALGADQLLAGTNRTRRSLNARARTLKGFTVTYPEPGERLVCLKNDHGLGLLNGSSWLVGKTLAAAPGHLRLVVTAEDSGVGDGKPIEVTTHPYFFDGRESEIDFFERKKLSEFDFGYAITVHKAQGSQWPHVMIFDESFVFREDRARHLYTAITRAAERVTVLL